MKKVLIIEDNAEVRENLAEILELSGYEALMATDGIHGVQVALKEDPDLILCDVMMPKLDGFGVLDILSKKPLTTNTPFIFLTAKAEAEDFRRGMNLGADDYITKPFLRDDLLRVIDTRLKKSDRIRAKYDKDKETWLTFIDKEKGYSTLLNLCHTHTSFKYSKKDLLFEEGRTPRHLYFLLSGSVKVTKTNDFGKELILTIKTPGDFFGFTALIRDKNYTFSAAAIDEIEVCQIPKNDFLKLFFSDRNVALYFSNIFAENIVEKEDLLLDLAYNSVRKRVAKTLLYLHKKFNKVESNEEISILRDDLAHLVGTAKESVIRMLTEFKDDGLIKIREGKIIILDAEGLDNMPG